MRALKYIQYAYLITVPPIINFSFKLAAVSQQNPSLVF